jgi:hypothetical protein
MTGQFIVTQGYNMDIRNNYAVITNLNVKLISTYPKISMLILAHMCKVPWKKDQ